MQSAETPWGPGLGGIAELNAARTRSISPENPTGAKGGAAKQVPPANSPAFRLGPGWKARPCIDLPAESTTTLAQIEGPGTIQHIWITVDEKAYRDCILRAFWDDEPNPSIEVPLGDFFACGHAHRTTVNSLPICVNPVGGFNSYWPMPFRHNARFTIENQSREDIRGFFYQINYALGDVSPNAACFHAQWRQSGHERSQPEHTLLDGVTGQGHYVGTYLAWTQQTNGWWGEGELKFFIDGDEPHPTICTTGTEDYFGGGWGFYGPENRETPYSTPFLGLPLVDHRPNAVPRYGLYRWHIMDPIRFSRSLRTTIQTLGWGPDGTYRPLTDEVASVAYWYQAEPHSAFPPLPNPVDRWPR